MADLSDQHLCIIKQRFVPLVQDVRMRAMYMSLMFYSSRVTVTVGSLLVPALLSIQNNSSREFAEKVYWAAWFTSLLVTICNGLQTLFKLDKKYYATYTMFEQLVSEGWQYVSLTSKYSGYYTGGRAPTHENQFILFCHSVEKIKMRQVEEEYYRLAAAADGQPQQAGTTAPTAPTVPSTLAAPSAAGPTAVTVLPTSPVRPQGSRVAPAPAPAAAAEGQQEQGGVAAAAAAAAAAARQSIALRPANGLAPFTPLFQEYMNLPEASRQAIEEQLARVPVDGVQPAPRGAAPPPVPQTRDSQTGQPPTPSNENRPAGSVPV
jgi:hypothetical protein